MIYKHVHRFLHSSVSYIPLHVFWIKMWMPRIIRNQFSTYAKFFEKQSFFIGFFLPVPQKYWRYSNYCTFHFTISLNLFSNTKRIWVPVDVALSPPLLGVCFLKWDWLCLPTVPTLLHLPLALIFSIIFVCLF